jgi:hypothetical protein
MREDLLVSSAMVHWAGFPRLGTLGLYSHCDAEQPSGVRRVEQVFPPILPKSAL